MNLEEIIPALALIAVLILVLPSFISSNIEKKTFFKNAIIQIEEGNNTLSIGPNLFPFNNPYEIQFNSNEEDTLKQRQTFIAKKTEKKISL